MTKSRFIILDGMRGVAAIAVMLFHFFPDTPGTLLYHSYLAVDFFFMLSGFVIAYTYEQKLKTGLSFLGFTLARAIRLYPLIVAGVLSVAVLRLAYPKPVWPTGQFLYNMIMNALLLPNSLTSASERFDFVPPSWSLFYEFTINLSYVLLLPMLNRKVLLILIGIVGFILAILAYQHGSVRLLHEYIPAGLARTMFSFLVGVLICRDFAVQQTKPFARSLMGQYALLVALLVFPSIRSWDWLYDLTTIFFIFPLMIAAAIRQPSAGNRKIESELGEISYPVYVLHMPVLAYIGVALGWAGSNQVIAVCAAIMTLIVAAVAWRIYDRPVRIWLSARLRRPDLQRKLHAEP